MYQGCHALTFALARLSCFTLIEITVHCDACLVMFDMIINFIIIRNIFFLVGYVKGNKFTELPISIRSVSGFYLPRGYGENFKKIN